MRNFLNRDIGIINFVWLFQNFIDDTFMKVLLQQGISDPVFYGNVRNLWRVEDCRGMHLFGLWNHSKQKTKKENSLTVIKK